MPPDARPGRARRGRATTTWRFVAVVAPLVLVSLLAFADIAARRVEAVAAQAAAAQLDAVRAGAEAAASAAWARIEDGVQRVAATEETAQALLDLSRATRASETDPRIDAAALAPQRAALVDHLERWYAPLAGRRPPLDDAIGLPATRRAQWLQAQYVAGAGLAADGPYAEAHARWHPRLSAIAAQHGLADLMLVRASDGLVVYDVAKTPIFQTSLLDGAFSDSRPGSLFRRARGAPAAGALQRADFAPFAPARDQALAFLAVPLFVGGDFVGVIVAAVDSRPLDAAVSADGRWDTLGLAADGDVILIGADGTPRSTPRQVAGAATDAPRLPPPAALVGSGAGPLEYLDAAGRETLASVGAPAFGELGWRAVATRDMGEAQRDAAAARRALLVAALVIGVLLVAAVAALTWWGTLPLRHLAAAMARLRLNDPRARVLILGRGEAAEIAEHVNGLLEQHRDERHSARQSHEREVRALAAALDAWQPGEPSPRIPAPGDLAPIGTALGRLADRLDDVSRSARLVPTSAAEALRAAAEQLRRDAERNLEALGAAEEGTRHAVQRVERAAQLAATALDGSRSAEHAARAEQATLRDVAASLERASGEARDERDAGARALTALGSGAQAAAALVDELSVLAVNAALQPAGAADDPLAESARVAVERAEQVGTELDATLADARASLAARASAAGDADLGALAAARRELDALVDVIQRSAQGVGDVDALLRATVDDRLEARVQAAVDSARRLRQTAELVASEAAAVASGVDASGA